MKILMSRTEAIEEVVDEAVNPEIMGLDTVNHEAMTSSVRLPSDPRGSITPGPPAAPAIIVAMPSPTKARPI